MNYLPRITSVAILFWGWQMGLIPMACIMMIIIESNRFIKSRWDFSEKDFNRISDFCTIILGGLLLYILATEPENIIPNTFKWLPIIVFPVLITQIYSTEGKIDLKSIMPLARKISIRRLKDIKKLDCSNLYVLNCIISTGTIKTTDNIFYCAMIVFCFWAIFPNRSKRYPWMLCFSILLIASIAGFYAHQGLYKLQGIITEYTINYFLDKEADLYKHSTSIGEIGELKLSSKIIMRIGTDKPGTMLLKRASYNAYRNRNWYATLSGFQRIEPEYGELRWLLNKKPKKKKQKELTYFTRFNSNTDIVPLPNGAYVIENLNVKEVQKNSLGVVKILGSSGFEAFTVKVKNDSWDRPPDSIDFEIPEKEEEHIARFLNKVNSYYGLNMLNLPIKERLIKLKYYFASHFEYSLIQKEYDNPTITPLENFLFQSRKGHCEFYATTTVLLLRSLKIPTRYVTGYMAHEYNVYEKNYIVRERDAHAWVLVWINGQWQNFDTTPPDWPNADSEFSGSSPISDFFSTLRFTFSKWRAEMTKKEMATLVLWILIPLGLYLIARLRFGEKIKRVNQKKIKKEIISEERTGFYLLEDKLSSIGYERYTWETFGMWIKRIGESGVMSNQSDELKKMLELHYKDRYSPLSVSDIEKEAFNTKTEEFINDLEEKRI